MSRKAIIRNRNRRALSAAQSDARIPGKLELSVDGAGLVTLTVVDPVFGSLAAGCTCAYDGGVAGFQLVTLLLARVGVTNVYTGNILGTYTGSGLFIGFLGPSAGSDVQPVTASNGLFERVIVDTSL